MSASLNRLSLPCALLIALPCASAVAADRMVVVNEGATAKTWAADPAKPRVVPGYPATFVDKSEDACVSIGYLLNRDGSTSDFTLLKSWGSRTPGSSEVQSRLDPLGQAAVAAVQQWRFIPAQGNRSRIKPVYTAATFAFSSQPGGDREAIRAHCIIADLPAFIAKAQADAYRRGNLQKGRLERDRVENPATISGH